MSDDDVLSDVLPPIVDLKPSKIYAKADLMMHERSRMAGYLDALRALYDHGFPDQRYVDYLVEKTGEEPVPLMDRLKVKIKEYL